MGAPPPAEDLRGQRSRQRDRTAWATKGSVQSHPGGPLARAEGRISLERILDRRATIRISEEHPGPPEDRRYRYEPTWVLRGLRQLHIEFDLVE